MAHLLASRSHHLCVILFVLALGAGLPAEKAAGGQVRQAAPSPAARAWQVQDGMVADLVVIRLAASSALAQADIHVSARKGMVRLGGVVPDREAKELAIRITSWTPGVRGICDELHVDPQVPSRVAKEVPGEQLAEEVSRKLAATFEGARAAQGWRSGWEVAGGRWGFSVTVKGGEALLIGSVPTFPDVRRAVEAARSIPGVRTVRSELYVHDYCPGGRYGPYGPFGAFFRGPRERPARPGYGYYGPYPPPTRADTIF